MISTVTNNINKYALQSLFDWITNFDTKKCFMYPIQFLNLEILTHF